MGGIKIKINGQEINCESGQTIMSVARANNIDIPGLCSHPDFPVKGNCRVCAVEIKGRRNLATSCSTKIEPGMEITTNSDRVIKARNMNIELIFAEHIEKCGKCIWRFQCPLLKYAEKYKIYITTFKDRKRDRKIYKFANAVEIDGSQCIDCRNCIDACTILQKINYLELKGKGVNQEVKPTKNKKINCILCGQCAVHCPVSSAQEQSHWEMVEKAIKDKNKVVVAQFAPSIRVSIGEDFGLPYGKIMTENVVAGLRALGFNYVFDNSFSADVTTIIEAEELISRLTKNGVMPMITSCCPGWVNFVEIYRPDLIKNLTTARSPQIHGGGLIKTYWAEKMKINPKNIIVVSIMPCTAKKFEASRPEMKINGLWPVDYVLTSREFSFLMKKNKVDFANIKKSRVDDPLGDYSGAGVIFGSSGGVMESALRTAQYILQTAQGLACDKKKKKECVTKIDFNEVRGLEGLKEAEIDLAGKKLRVGVLNSIGNIDKILSRLNDFDYLEVMACPGGCIGGGGQPIPTTSEIRKKRMAALYQDDKKRLIRNSFENKGAQDVLKWLGEKGKLTRQVLHTTYKKRIKY